MYVKIKKKKKTKKEIIGKESSRLTEIICLLHNTYTLYTLHNTFCQKKLSFFLKICQFICKAI